MKNQIQQLPTILSQASFLPLYHLYLLLPWTHLSPDLTNSRKNLSVTGISALMLLLFCCLRVTELISDWGALLTSRFLQTLNQTDWAKFLTWKYAQSSLSYWTTHFAPICVLRYQPTLFSWNTSSTDFLTHQPASVFQNKCLGATESLLTNAEGGPTVKTRRFG